MWEGRKAIQFTLLVSARSLSENFFYTLTMESLAQLEVLCERLYTSQDSTERAHAERTLKCFSTNADYISQCQYILDNASTSYALMMASSSLLKQVMDHSLPLQLRLDIRNILVAFKYLCPHYSTKKCVLLASMLCGSLIFAFIAYCIYGIGCLE